MKITLLKNHVIIVKNSLLVFGLLGFKLLKIPLALKVCVINKTKLFLLDYGKKMLAQTFINKIKNTIKYLNTGIKLKLVCFGRAIKFIEKPIDKTKVIVSSELSHLVIFILPKNVFIAGIEKKMLTLSSSDKNVLTLFAQKITKYFKRDSYKGKGIAILGKPFIKKTKTKK